MHGPTVVGHPFIRADMLVGLGGLGNELAHAKHTVVLPFLAHGTFQVAP